MGSGDCFKTILNLKKAKQDRSKRRKSDTKSSNGSKRHEAGKEFGSLANGSPCGNGEERIDNAATKIQAAIRAYMARKALQRQKGVVRVKGLIESHTAKNQAISALNHIHSWSKIQEEIRARRIRMILEDRTRQKKLENQLKLEAKLHDLEVEWCGGSETMEEILMRIQHRETAAVKRERAMAYAFSHQWRANTSQYFGQAYYDLGKESWGWSWTERWIAIRPWETRVQVQCIIPNKALPKQGNKPSPSTKQSPIKILVSEKPNLPNGKVNSKARKLSY